MPGTGSAKGDTLHFMHYNFARIHQTLRITPAMAAGVASHVWSLWLFDRIGRGLYRLTPSQQGLADGGF